VRFQKYCDDIQSHFSDIDDSDLQKMEVTLNRTSKSYPFWYLINGPLTDAVHHICQMVTWRRISGNPTPRISPFTGKSY